MKNLVVRHGITTVAELTQLAEERTRLGDHTYDAHRPFRQTQQDQKCDRFDMTFCLGMHRLEEFIDAKSSQKTHTSMQSQITSCLRTFLRQPNSIFWQTGSFPLESFLMKRDVAALLVRWLTGPVPDTTLYVPLILNFHMFTNPANPTADCEIGICPATPAWVKPNWSSRRADS